jgi:hypothetical protein
MHGAGSRVQHAAAAASSLLDDLADHFRHPWPARRSGQVIWSVVSTQYQQDAQVRGSIGVAADEGAALCVRGVVVPLQPPADLAFALAPVFSQHLAPLIAAERRVHLVHLPQ